MVRAPKVPRRIENIASVLCFVYTYELQRSSDGEDALSDCVEEVFQYTVNTSRLRTESTDGRSATFQQRPDDADLDRDTVELVYVADVADTNLLMVVVDGRPTAATTVGTAQRQVLRPSYSRIVIVSSRNTHSQFHIDNKK